MAILSSCLAKLSFDTATLVKTHPLQIQNRNKILVNQIAWPNDHTFEKKEITFSRWKSISVSDSTPAFPAQSPKIIMTQDTFDYIPGGVDEVLWWVNFADANLFFGYGGSLLAQDELQVAEHPILGNFREALRSNAAGPEGKPLCVEEGGKGTPCLFFNVERACEIKGIYGHAFGPADENKIRKCTRKLTPPTYSNIIAIAAPGYQRGTYTLEQVNRILDTAFTAFRAAREESVAATPGKTPRVVIHTGNWGCGAFGGNVKVMTILQLAAAHLAEIDVLHYHSVDPNSATQFKSGEEIWHTIRDKIVQKGASSQAAYNMVLSEVVALNLKWGLSNGT